MLIPYQGYNVAKYGVVSRFLTVSFKELIDELFVVIPSDHNIIAYIIKTSLFGEFSYENIFVTAKVLKIINAIIILNIIYLNIMCVIKNKQNKNNKFITNLLLLTEIVSIISYYLFNIQYPYICTMDFRYIAITVFTGITLAVIIIDQTIENKIYIKTVFYVILCFCMLSTIMFFVI